MKRMMFFALSALFVLTAGTPGIAQIYWDTSKPADETISDRDFTYRYKGLTRTKTFGDQEIYDTAKTPSQEEISEAEPSRPAVVSTEPDAVVPEPARPMPALRTPIQPRNLAAPRQTNVVPQDTVRPAPLRLPETNTPAAAVQQGNSVTSVRIPTGKPQQVEPEVNRGTPVPATAKSSDEPVTKKMQWGQSESKPSGSSASEPNKSGGSKKFEWGQR